jgi:hypothetical protein
VLLGAFDFAVPVGAFDQPHHQPPTAPPRKISQPLDEREGPFLISLHGETEPIPAGEIGGERQCLEEIEREFEAIGFLGIDRQTDADPPRVAREVEQNGGHLGEHPIALRHLVARVQRRQFDRDAWRLDAIPTFRRRAYRGDGAIVSDGVACGVRGCMRGFSKHVVGIPVAVLLDPLPRSTASSMVRPMTN